MNGIEEMTGANSDAGMLQAFGSGARQSVYMVGYSADAIWAVVNSIHGGHYRQKRLSCTNIGGCFVSFDVLFAGLQGHA